MGTYIISPRKWTNVNNAVNTYFLLIFAINCLIEISVSNSINLTAHNSQDLRKDSINLLHSIVRLNFDLISGESKQTYQCLDWIGSAEYVWIVKYCRLLWFHDIIPHNTWVLLPYFPSKNNIRAIHIAVYGIFI